MLIGANEASALLMECGLTRRHAQRVLGAGLAGAPRRLRSRVLYDRDQVLELARRPSVRWSELLDLCPAGVFVSRRHVATSRPEDLLDARQPSVHRDPGRVRRPGR